MKKIFYSFLCFVTAWLVSFTSFATTFRIDAGDHYSYPKVLKLFNGRKMTFTAIFDQSAQYIVADGSEFSDQADTNKLYGFADCHGTHMENSARFGWRWFQGQLEIRTFTHKNGVYSSKPIGVAQFNQPMEYSIEISEDNEHYIYTFDGNVIVTDRGCSNTKALGYHLQPYFGGNQKAPHDVSIQVDIKNGFGPLTITNVFPNPVKDGKINFKIESFAETYFYFDVFDMMGRKIYKSPTISINSIGESVLLQEIPQNLASGMYIIRPVTVDTEGNAEKAAVTFNNNEEVIKILVIH